MKCYQCDNNAMYEVGPEKVPLCLQCYALLQQTYLKQNEALREEINFLHDSADSIFGIRTGARYPTKRPVLVSGGTINNNHIAINNSQIGMLNTGNINSLNQTIDTLYTTSQKNLADNIKRFSEAVLIDKDLTDIQRTEIFESLDIVTRELLQEPENRKKSVAGFLLEKISSTIQVAASSLTIWEILQPLIQSSF
jgi:hypothetical protein